MLSISIRTKVTAVFVEAYKMFTFENSVLQKYKTDSL